MIAFVLAVALSQADGGVDAPLAPRATPSVSHCDDADMPKDRPGWRVCLRAGTPAPWDGMLNSFGEEARLAKRDAKAEGTQAAEKRDDAIVSKPVFIAVVCVAVAGVAAAIASGACAASNCLKR